MSLEYIKTLTLSNGKTYEIDKLLGRGAYGEVYLCTIVNGSGTKYAIKTFTHYIQRKDDWEAEIKTLEWIKDKCDKYLLCMKSYGVKIRGKEQYYDEEKGTFHKYDASIYCIIYEYLDGYIELKKLITNQNTNLTIKTLPTLIYELARGMTTLHHLGVSHFDISLTNIMVKTDQTGEAFHIKYIDYGVALRCDDTHKDSDGYYGSYMFTDPYSRKINRNGKDRGLLCFQSDLYSLGMIIVEMLNYILKREWIYVNKDNKLTSPKYIYDQNKYRQFVITNYINDYKRLFINDRYDITTIFSTDPNVREIVFIRQLNNPPQQNPENTPQNNNPPSNINNAEKNNNLQPKAQVNTQNNNPQPKAQVNTQNNNQIIKSEQPNTQKKPDITNKPNIPQKPDAKNPQERLQKRKIQNLQQNNNTQQHSTAYNNTAQNDKPMDTSKLLNHQFTPTIRNEEKYVHKFGLGKPGLEKRDVIEDDDTEYRLAFAEDTEIENYMDNDTLSRKDAESKYESTVKELNEKDLSNFHTNIISKSGRQWENFKNTVNDINSSLLGGSNKRYTIRRYTYGKARKLGVRVRPSTKKDKKLDVFRHNKKIASIGARGMGDYPTFRQTRGHTFANRRRRAYKIRHQRDRTKRWSRGWLADQLLW